MRSINGIVRTPRLRTNVPLKRVTIGGRGCWAFHHHHNRLQARAAWGIGEKALARGQRQRPVPAWGHVAPGRVCGRLTSCPGDSRTTIAKKCGTTGTYGSGGGIAAGYIRPSATSRRHGVHHRGAAMAVGSWSSVCPAWWNRTHKPGNPRDLQHYR